MSRTEIENSFGRLSTFHLSIPDAFLVLKMSEAISLSSSVSYHSNDITQARQKRLAATLVYLIRDFKSNKNQIEQLKEEIENVDDEISTIVHKRRRLSSQNFSSSPHLKPTHSKYWNQQQNLLKKKKKYMKELVSYQKSSCKMARKITDIRSILQYH